MRSKLTQWVMQLPRLQQATLAICCAAPVLTWFLRSGQAPPEAYRIFQRLFFFNDNVGSWAMLAALLIALSARGLPEVVARWAQWVGENPGWTCAAAFLGLAAGARFVYMAHPLSMDEYAPWMQAHAFAGGQLTVQYPPDLIDWIVPKWFQGVFIVVNRSTGDAISGYFPGLALALAPFAKLDLAWCANPALSVMALALIGDLAARSGGGASCRGWAMLAALASPQFTVNAMSFYAMPGLLALNLLFLWLLLRGTWQSAFVAGLVGGWALAMHNPVPHALMAIPCWLWLAANPRRWGRLSALAVGYLPVAACLGVGWSMLASAVRSTPGVAAATAAGTGAGTGTAAGLIVNYLSSNLRMLHWPLPDLIEARWFAVWKTWIWACPGLLFLPFLITQRDLVQKLLIAALVLTFVFHFWVPFDQGHGWGFRYIHPVWALFPIAGGLWMASTPAAARFGAIAVAAGLLATPAFLWQTHRFIAGAVAQRIEAPAEGRWVVFVAQQPGRYSGDLVQNAPGMERVLHLVSRGEVADRELMSARFPQAVAVRQDKRGSLWRIADPDGGR